ncbi:MAG: TIGR03960 family B12-binding radical SAM protein [Clostridiales bacterium]|nr:TIGR03960 family B12-binding radical SAM protein [Clostridiales bacterium]
MNIEYEFEKLLKRVEKPARYTGGEVNEVQKDPGNCSLRFGFAFPDMYEIGMSYLGLQVLYSVLNERDGTYCERVFAPAPDMESLMRERGVPLFTLETKTPVRELDILGFTLQYELSYTNVLNMLSLAGIPVFAKDRGEGMPFVVGGGPCAFNPEPVAGIFDAFLIGDGEEAVVKLCGLYESWKASGEGKASFLEAACRTEGVYVPSFYEPCYLETGEIGGVKKLFDGAADRVKKSVLWDLNSTVPPEKCIVPLIETVHDRAVVETFRGCTRGCRFCQAGMIYRPVRERSSDSIIGSAERQLKATGHEELSLLSLSTSDHSEFEPLATRLMAMCKENNVSLSLPSLRLDSFSFKALGEIGGYKKSGLTFAPEAGTQRLRDVINKNITEESIFGSVSQAAELGWGTVKLYFMVGLPTETYEDLDGIAEIARRIMEACRKGRMKLTVSVSNFVPKAHTPFQWEAQDAYEDFVSKHDYLKEKLKIKGVSFSYHDSCMSVVEAALARGDRRVTAALVNAWEKGCRFDAWSEHFNYSLWKEAFEEAGVSMGYYASRKRKYDEALPWDVIDCLVSKEYLITENEKSKSAETTEDCRQGCRQCGINT